ncbi:hypothetical protein EV382_3577 [Micromonospora violae]|uniref:Uncharacterized protein n=1 Tax=Micromonospora violae TaxID=1278207 RepID=A0A4Q7UL11_9ACTN|nr:hypothetical protein [Micromonospora violae]RZT80329.1 hypothetical protein EV382_3577 [Micromonospora violae]
MNGRRVLVGGVLLAVGVLPAVPATWVLVSGEPAALPIVIFGLAAAVFGAAQLRTGLREPAAPRVRPVPGQRRRHADTSMPATYYGSDSGGWDWGGGDSGGGGGGDSGGGGGGS